LMICSRIKRKLFLAFLVTATLLHLFPIGTPAQSRMDTVLYGVSYYHEYMPYERLDKDVQMMKEAGISVVRMGESSWGLWEPEEGRFEFAWMDRILERMHQAGIRVLL